MGKSLVQHTRLQYHLSITKVQSTTTTTTLYTVPLVSLNWLVLLFWGFGTIRNRGGVKIAEYGEKAGDIAEVFYCVVSIAIVSVSWGIR